MKTLDLYKVWEILNKVSNRQEELWEEDKFVRLLGIRSNYSEVSFDRFLQDYSFYIDVPSGILTIFSYFSHFDDDLYVNESFLPLVALNCDIDKWLEEKVKEELEQLELNKESNRRRIEADIMRLQKTLEDGNY